MNKRKKPSSEPEVPPEDAKYAYRQLMGMLGDTQQPARKSTVPRDAVLTLHSGR